MHEAYFTLYGLGAVIFGILCFFFVFLTSFKKRKISFLGWSVFFYGLIYGISAPLIVASIRDSPESFVGSNFVFDNVGALSWHVVAAILSVGGVIVGWGIASAMRRTRSVRARPLFTGLNSPDSFGRVFWLMVIVGFTAQVLYAIDYGGLSGVIDYSRLVRSHMLEESERSRFSFLKPVAGFSMLACFGFLGLILSRVRKFSVILGFGLSLAFSLYLLYTWQGRLGAVTFIAIIFLAIVLIRDIHPGTLILSFFGLAFAGMYLVYMVSEIWDLKTSESFSQFYARELSFIFSGFWAEVSQSNNTFRLFYDVAVLPLHLLPSSLTLGWVEDVTSVHTAVMFGAPKGEHGVTSGMPLDIITMGYLQMDVLGIFVYGVLFGILLRILQTMVDHVELPGIHAALTAYIALKICAFALFYAQPSHIIGNNFPLIVTLIFLAFIRMSRPVRRSLQYLRHEQKAYRFCNSFEGWR